MSNGIEGPKPDLPALSRYRHSAQPVNAVNLVDGKRLGVKLGLDKSTSSSESSAEPAWFVASVMSQASSLTLELEPSGLRTTYDLLAGRRDQAAPNVIYGERGQTTTERSSCAVSSDRPPLERTWSRSGLAPLDQPRPRS